MDLEGVDTLLYNLEDDPKELNSLTGEKDVAVIEEELRGIAQQNWSSDDMRALIAADQKRRLFIHQTTDGEPTYVNVVRHDDASRYIRNAGAADTKALARLPFVEPAKPDNV